MSISTWVGSFAAGGGPPPGPGPTNLVLPSIVGVAEVGQTVEWDVGIWDTATSFDIEVVITGGARDGEVVLARTSVAGDTTGSIVADLTDQSIILKVWGINGSGETLAQSAAFGPIVVGFVARSVSFDGTDYLTNAALSPSITCSGQGTMSLWFRVPTGTWNTPNGQRLFRFMVGAADALILYTASAGRFIFGLYHNGSGSDLTTIDIPGDFQVGSDKWYNLIFAWDRAANKFQIAFNRTVWLNSTTYFNGATALDMEASPLTRGNIATSASTLNFIGDLGHIWADFNTFLDLTVSANLDKFVATSGLPVDLGAKGELATGTEPDLYFDGDATTFNNVVTGGPTLTLVGTLTDGPAPQYVP